MRLSPFYPFGIAGIFGIMLSGCNSASGSLGDNYDLASYLFPSTSGTYVYKEYTAQKPEGENHFTEPEYTTDLQYQAEYQEGAWRFVDKADTRKTTLYTITSDQITVEEEDENLTYHLRRTTDRIANLVEEDIVKTWTETNGKVTITYE